MKTRKQLKLKIEELQTSKAKLTHKLYEISIAEILANAKYKEGDKIGEAVVREVYYWECFEKMAVYYKLINKDGVIQNRSEFQIEEDMENKEFIKKHFK